MLTMEEELEFKQKKELLKKGGFIEDFDKKYPYRAMGISNGVWDSKNKKIYSVQFYDFDYIKGRTHLTPKEVDLIKTIYPYDCIMYQTAHGIHFISFAILKGLTTTRKRAEHLTKQFIFQDFIAGNEDLILRVSCKGKKRMFKKHYQIISKKPKFLGLVKSPNKYLISKRHLEFYRNYMFLPEWVYSQYNDCKLLEGNIKLYHYRTGD